MSALPLAEWKADIPTARSNRGAHLPRLARPWISVVIPTYHRPDLLRRCLEALFEQTLPRSAYEIVVSDDAASAATHQLVESWSSQGVAVRYAAVRGTHGPAAARNQGWRAARAEIIAFTDDDCVPDRRWLERGLTALDAADAVAGRIVMPLSSTPTDYERNAAGLAGAAFATANCFCRRAALEAVGGFDERFTSAWREDSDLQFSLLEHGFRVRTAPEAVVVHPIRPAPWGISLTQQQKSRFEALLYANHPTLYRERIHSTPWRYYAMVGTLVGAIAAALVGRRQAALTLGGTWVGMTGRFCAERLNGTSRAAPHVAEMAVTSAVIPLLSIYWRLRGALQYRVRFL